MTGERPSGEDDSKHADNDGDWRLIDSVVEYETGWYTGGYDLLEQPDGSRKKYYWAALPPAVIVVAKRGTDLVFVEQYRPAIREHCLELPAGLVADGEAYEDAAARELAEETGYEPATLELLEDFWVATGVLRHERGVVVASDLSRTASDLDENEFLTVRTCPIEDALDRARTPPVNDATLEGILLAKAEGFL